MNTDWIRVIVAAFFEIIWVIGLKHANNPWEWTGTFVCMVISFYLMVTSGKNLPVGTVYAVFVGLGTAGTVFADIAFFGEPFKVAKIILIVILLGGIIGLKLVTKDHVTEGE